MTKFVYAAVSLLLLGVAIIKGESDTRGIGAHMQGPSIKANQTLVWNI